MAIQQLAGAEDILLSFNGTNNEQAVYIESVIDREKTVSETIIISVHH